MTNSAPKQAPETTITPEATSDGTRDNISKSSKPKDSYVKLAMRNMVRKGGQSLWHFFLTTAGLVGVLIGLAYLTKP